MSLEAAIERLESFTAALVNMTMLPDSIHVECLRSGLPKVIKELRAASDESGTTTAYERLSKIRRPAEDSLLVAAVKKLRRGDLPNCKQPLWDEIRAALAEHQLARGQKGAGE